MKLHLAAGTRKKTRKKTRKEIRKETRKKTQTLELASSLSSCRRPSL